MIAETVTDASRDVRPLAIGLLLAWLAASVVVLCAMDRWERRRRGSGRR